MQRKRISSLNMFIVAAATGLLATGAQAALDAPHNASNSIGCTSCHVMTSTLPKMLPPLDHTPVNIDDTLANNVCWSCHNDVDAVHRETHSSTLLGTGYGNWSVECWVCHNEHSQDQNRYNGSTYGKYIRRTIDLSKITGLVKTGKMPVVFTGPATFADGLSPYNGICEVCHTQTTHFQNDGGGATNGHDGKGGQNCVTCHNHSTSFQGGADHSTFITDDNETGNPAKLCSSCHTGYAANPETAHSACAVCHTTAPTLLDSAFPTYNGQIDDDGTSMFANLTDAAVAPYTQYIYPNGGGRLEAPGGLVITSVGFPKVRCGECHKAKPNALQAGNHGGHSATDFPWDATTQTSCGTVGCHDYVANGNVVQNIHGGTCTICHNNAGGGDGTTIVGSVTNGVDGDATLGSTASPHADNCLVCHPAATYDRSTVHHDSKTGYAAAGNCTQCHAGTNYPGDHSLRVSLAANCADCHNGTQGLASGQPVNAADNKVHDACTTCHNTDADATLKAAYGKAQAMPNGGAGSNNGGGSCEACHTSGFSGYHATVSHSPMVSLYVNCATCHTGTEAPAGGAVPLDVANNKKHDACTVCHGADGRLIGSAAGHNGATNGGSDGGGNCSVCHGEYMYNHTSINHSTTVALNVNCADCHTGTEGNATTVPLDPLNNKKHDTCSQCHAADGALVGSAATHDGGTGGGTDGGGNCSTCHSTFYANHAASVDHAIMVQAYANCSTCHLATGNTVDPLDPKVHDACASCHGVDGRLAGSASTHDGGTNGGSDGGGNCAVCHGEYFPNHTNIDHTLTVASGCTPCHTGTEGTTTTVPLNPAADKLHDTCSVCHQATGILVTTSPNGWAPLMGTVGLDGGTGGGKDGGGDCIACHNDYFDSHIHGTTGGYVQHDVAYNAGVDLAQDAPGTGCATCHNGNNADGNGIALDSWTDIVGEHTAGVITCDRCHNYLDDGSNTPPQATNDNAIASGTNVTCVTCHTSKLTPLKHGSHDATQFAWTASCGTAACHDQATNPDVTNDIHGNGTTALCTICHTTSSGGTGTAKVGANGDGDATLGISAAPHAGVQCTTCHDVADLDVTPDSLGGIHHHQSGSVVYAPSNCATCHANPNHTSMVVTTAACTGCHDTTPGGYLAKDAITSPFTGAGEVHSALGCVNCHDFNTAPGYGGVLRASYGDAANLSNGGTVAWVNGTDGGGLCTDCHLNGTDHFKGGLHHNTVSAANNNCTVCHDGTRIAQNHSATVATQATCIAANCHTAATVGTATTISVDPADGLKHKACRSCHAFDGTLSGVLKAAPGTKGVNNLSNNGDDSRVDVTPNGGGNCIICHNADGTGAGRVAFHHQNVNTAGGNCDYCHYDHRPTTGYSTANITNSIFDSTGGGTIPTHLPCEECHVKHEDNTNHAAGAWSTSNVRVAGYNGTSMTVVAWNKGSNTYKTATRWTTTYARTNVHVIPNTQTQIDNWGICITCHDGTATLLTGLTAAQLQPYHALPTAINNKDHLFAGPTSYNTTYGKGMYLPGRTPYNQITNMNYYGDDWRPTGTYPNGDTHRVLGGTWTGTTQSARTLTTTLERRSNQYNSVSKANGKTWLGTLTTTVTEKLVPNPWTGVQANNPYAAIRDQLPIFAPQTPATDQVPSADRISVTSAAIIGANLDVVASVTNGNCTDLTLQTGAGNVAFNASCQASIAYSYPANGTMVSVVSSQEDIEVTNYPITP